MRHSTGKFPTNAKRARREEKREAKREKKRKKKFSQQRVQYYRKGVIYQPTEFDRILSGDTVPRGEPFDWAYAASRLDPAIRSGRRRHASA